MEDMIDYYLPYKDKFKFTVIDDGSKIQPASREWIPEWWRILQVTEDLGWGNEVCRNILMKETTTDWNVMIDLDYRLPYDTLDILDDAMSKYDPETVMEYQFETGRRNWSHPENETDFLLNQYVMSRQTFSKTYGYDMAFAWVWGNDISLFCQFDHEPIKTNGPTKIPNTKLDWYTNFATEHNKEIVNENGVRWGREILTQEIDKLYEKYKPFGYNPKGHRWESEEQRQKFVQPFPEYVEL